ncbi:MAG TPA: CoA transferase [Dehalococcoidia bacterium]|nr:CoA transferase [Dehalococcoidia bacterium]
MDGPLAGIRVLEVANWLAAPAGCALLADFGADVIKVEPPNGDPYRGYRAGPDGRRTANVAFAADNRGKRAITLSLDQPGARDVLYRLVTDADVFVTNLLPRRRERYGLTYDALTQHRPDLIFVSVTGYGSDGPDRDRAGYDYAAFWARTGIMGLFGEPGTPPPPQRPGMGDHTTAMLIAGSVAMALLDRHRTGNGQTLDISLHNTGLWVLASDVNAALRGNEPARVARSTVPNPLWNNYRTKDGRWIMLVMLVSDMYWPQFCRAIEREELEHDPRFARFDNRSENREELIAMLDELFAERTLEEWAPALDAHSLIWAPAKTLEEVIADPQTRARGAFTTIEHPDAGDIEIVDTPVKFGRSTVGARGAAPELGQHTEQVLIDSGYGWDEITALRDAGTI